MQVGATAAVGLLEGGSGISWAVLNKTIVGWIMTLVVVGFLSALIMALGVFTPNLNASKALTKIKGQVNEVGMVQAENLDSQCTDAQEKVLVRCGSMLRVLTPERLLHFPRMPPLGVPGDALTVDFWCSSLSQKHALVPWHLLEMHVCHAGGKGVLPGCDCAAVPVPAACGGRHHIHGRPQRGLPVQRHMRVPGSSHGVPIRCGV